MDPERIHAYLQAACAGLGFDIGEVWFSSMKEETSSVTSFEPRLAAPTKSNNIKFLQLYTSKSFNSRRNDLLRPENEDDPMDSSSSSFAESNSVNSQSLSKHVLSPMVVNDIAKNAQVVWANCPKQEGLLGRSDMRLQTAVGMPVAMDASGNMCIVVMFSPRIVSNSKDAMEFIKLISQGAASSSAIPCLLPVVDNSQKGLEYNPKRFSDWQQNEIKSENDWSLDAILSRDGQHQAYKVVSTESNRLLTADSANTGNDMTFLPKDQYGIPILPEFAELNTDANSSRGSGASSPTSENLGEADEFDSATYGLWSTIMNSPKMKAQNPDPKMDLNISTFPLLQNIPPTLATTNKPIDIEYMHPERKERLEEFAIAFLGLSVFDIADVWVPVPSIDSNVSVTLNNVFAVSSNEGNNSKSVTYFKNVSRNTVVKGWSGAVGRSQCSGNAVWSTNQEIIVDSGRKEAFLAVNVKTAMAIPIFSQGSHIPACVLCCYSMVKSDSVTFILKFVQQALRSLWAGLDKVEPHKSIGKELWKGVAPADLGEMAADTEMQKAFYKKKRPFDMITKSSTGKQMRVEESRPDCRARSSSLAFQLQSLSSEKISPPQQYQQAPEQVIQRNLPTPIPVSVPIAPVVSQPTANIIQQPSPTNIIQQPPPANITQPASTNSFVAVPQTQPQQHQNFVFNQSNPVSSSSMQNPNPNGFKEDIEVAKGYINTINALVQQNTAHLQSMGQNIHNYQNIGSDNFAPESTMSSGTILCGAVNSSTPPVNTFAQPVTRKVAGKVCRIVGCNAMSVSRRPYCARHSGNRLCEFNGCTKCAQGATRFCIAHGGGRRCTFPGCDKGARDKFFCAAHGGGKRCSKDGCTKSAVGGSNLCTSHGGGRRCAIDGCMKSAQSSTKFCVKHGGGKKCIHAGCEKVARGRTLYCAGHGGGVRCKLEGCSRIAIGKMQLCRAHGGGSSRAKSKATKTVSPQNVAPQAYLQPSIVHTHPSGTIPQPPI